MVNRDALSGIEGKVIDVIADGITSSEWGKFLRRPLENAARSGDEEFAGKLCEAGADYGNAFDYAADGKQLGVIRVLAEHLSKSKPVSYADVTTEAASDTGCVNVSPLVLANNSALKLALVCAAREEDTTTVDYLLAAGAGVDAGDAVHAILCSGTSTSRVILGKILGDGLGCTAVGAPDRDGKLPLHANIGVEVADILFDNGAPVDGRVGGGRTPMYEHIVKGRFGVVERLLVWDADVNIKCTQNRTPVFAAASASYREGGIQMLEKIVNSGGCLHVKDSCGATPLHYATSGAAVGYIVSAGVDVNAMENRSQNTGGGTALHKASRNLRVESVKTLLEKEADETIRDHDGKTPLEVVGEIVKVNAPAKRVRTERIKVLLKNKQKRAQKRARPNPGCCCGINPPCAGASAGH